MGGTRIALRAVYHNAKLTKLLGPKLGRNQPEDSPETSLKTVGKQKVSPFTTERYFIVCNDLRMD